MSAEKQTKASPPKAEVREGGVKIAIWERQGEKGAFYTAGKPELSYNDGEKWRNDVGSYSEFDVVDLMVAAAKAEGDATFQRKVEYLRGFGETIGVADVDQQVLAQVPGTALASA